MSVALSVVLESLPSPPGSPLGYAEFWVPYAERDPTEWRLLWQRIVMRDGAGCWYCKQAMRPGTLDHVVPRSLGGSDHMTNLRASCLLCNELKANLRPEDFDPNAALSPAPAVRATVLGDVGEHVCSYPADDLVYGLCTLCGRRRSKQSRKTAQRAAARRYAGPHVCTYPPGKDAVCHVCATGRSKASRKRINRRERMADDDC